VFLWFATNYREFFAKVKIAVFRKRIVTAMMILKYANLALAFALELAMLAAFAFWGFGAVDSTILRIVLGVGIPLIVAGIWGTYLSPRAAKPVSPQIRVLLEVGLFGGAALALAVAGQVTLAAIFAVLVVINQVLLRVWKQ
jgi:hypothetical protein